MDEDVINKIRSSVDLVVFCIKGCVHKLSGERAVGFLEMFAKKSFFEYVEEAVSKHSKLIDNAGRIQFNVTPQDYTLPIFLYRDANCCFSSK